MCVNFFFFFFFLNIEGFLVYVTFGVILFDGVCVCVSLCAGFRERAGTGPLGQDWFRPATQPVGAGP